jgi:hypothetical protein
MAALRPAPCRLGFVAEPRPPLSRAPPGPACVCTLRIFVLLSM